MSRSKIARFVSLALSVTLMLGIITIRSTLSTALPSAIHHDHYSGHHEGGAQGGQGGLTPASAKEFYKFDDLNSMTATSDAVLEATVMVVQPGAYTEEVPGEIEGSIGYRNVTLRVDAVHHIKGITPIEPGDTLLLIEIAEASGKQLIVENVSPSEVGDAGFYFLGLDGVESEGSENYLSFILISSQGRYLVQPDDSLVGANQSDPLVTALQTLTASQMRAGIAQAVDAFASGESQPLPPPIPCGLQGCVSADPSIEVVSPWDYVPGWGIHFACEATAVNAISEVTAITACYVEDRGDNYPSREDAPTARTEGNVAATVGFANDPHKEFFIGSSDPWLCWTTTADFGAFGMMLEDDCQSLRS